MHGSGGKLTGRNAGLAGLAIVAGLLLTATASAQGLEEYDYANLGFRGFGVEVLYVNASQNEGTLGIGARLDLGFLGPNVRVVPRFGYWKAGVEASQVSELEAQLEVASGLAPGSISLGNIERSAYIIGSDFQWTAPDGRVSPYIGIGLDAYILNDDGTAIRNTFLDDLVITAGVSGTIGTRISLSDSWRFYGEVRGAAVPDASSLGIAAGLMVVTGN
jgi:hypothetical protein